MAFKFRNQLDEDSVARLDAMEREMARIHALPDRWLAEELLKLSRRARQEFPDKLKDPRGVTYDPNFVWHVVPELAKRLGATRLRPNEATDPGYAQANPAELRILAGVYLKNLSLGNWCVRIRDKDRGLMAGEILAHAIANGNPAAMAADRIHPAPEAGQDAADWIASHVREISSRRGHEETPYWSPALQVKPPHGPEVAEASMPAIAP